MAFSTMILNLLVILTLFVSAKSQISNYFESKDTARIQTIAKKSILNPINLKNVFYGASILQEFLGESKLACDCESIRKLSNAINSSYEVYHVEKINAMCECGLKLDSERFSKIIETSFKSNELPSLAGAILASNHRGTLTNDVAADVVQKIKSLHVPLKSATKSQTPIITSTYISQTHMVLEMLTVYYKHGDKWSEVISEFFDKGFELLPDDDEDSLTDPSLVTPLSRLTDKKLRLIGSRLISTTEGLLLMKYSSDVTALYLATQGLKVITTYKATPVFIGLSTSKFSHNLPSTHILKLKSVDVFGTEIVPTSVEISSIKFAGKDLPLSNDVTFSKSLELDLSNQKLSSGRYLVQLSLTYLDRPKSISFQTYFMITNSIKIKDVLFGVSDTKSRQHAELFSVSTENELSSDLSANAVLGDNIHFEFIVTGKEKPQEKIKKPHQAFIRFVESSTGMSINFAAKKVSNDGQGEDVSHSYELSVALADELKTFGYTSGDYQIYILVGDVTYPSSTEWFIGSIQLIFPAKSVQNLPLYAKSLLHTSDITLTPLPEIVHQMRPPAKRASNFMAGLFTILTIMPLVIYLIYIVGVVKPDLSKLISTSSIAFVICLIVTLLLYIGYWFAVDGISFYQTIKYLCFLLPITAMIGSYALDSVAKVGTP